MKKIIILMMTFSLNSFATEYKVVVTDHKTGEVAEQLCANEIELSQVATFVARNADEYISMKVSKLNVQSVDAIKKGGGEGGTD